MREPIQLIDQTAPFPAQVVQQLPASNGRPALDYVTWHQYSQRLLFQHGPYSWVITSVQYGGNEWTVAGQLVLGDDEQYGGVGTDRSSDNAESQAFKRACAKAGIGLHLYCKPGAYWLHDRLQEQFGGGAE